MATAIFEGDRFTSFGAEKHYRLTQEDAAERLPANLVRQGGDVPTIL
jgi:hypothetical protein